MDLLPDLPGDGIVGFEALATSLNDSIAVAAVAILLLADFARYSAGGCADGHANSSVDGHVNSSVDDHANSSVDGHANSSEIGSAGSLVADSAHALAVGHAGVVDSAGGFAVGSVGVLAAELAGSSAGDSVVAFAAHVDGQQAARIVFASSRQPAQHPQTLDVSRQVVHLGAAGHHVSRGCPRYHPSYVLSW